ncbi:MAG: GIY-YIG nuclease family protein [Patescibacteria group bacterium]
MNTQSEKLLRKAQTAPRTPGVYFFKNVRRVVLYIGKANNLRVRLRQYFQAGDDRLRKTSRMLEEATTLSWNVCASEADALITEAQLIKKYTPKFNVILRDDKQYLYVGITKGEPYPRIFLTHQPAKISKQNLGGQTRFIGPFTSGYAVKEIMRLLRRVYPYCTCRAGLKRPCLQYQLGRCLGATAKPETRPQTKRNVNAIAAILSGRRQSLACSVERSMRTASRAQEFQKAHRYKTQLDMLRDIFEHRGFLTDITPLRRPPAAWSAVEEKLRNVSRAPHFIRRVECYDISNISGKYAVGSMVVFENGIPAKSEYRKFRIKFSGDTPDDPKMMREVLARRIKHAEWPTPDLIIVDGGKTQLNAALAVLPPKQTVIALAKRNEELRTPSRTLPIPAASFGEPVLHFVQQIRDEAHRFAITYHKKLRSQSVLTK